MRQAGWVAHIGDTRNTKFWQKNLKGRFIWGRLGISG